MNIDIKILSKDIKRYLLKGIKLADIKKGALEQGVSEEIFNKSVAILVRKAKIKKRILLFSQILTYFFTSIILFYAYFAFEFSQKEIQMESHYLEFIKKNLPSDVFKKIRNSKKIKVIDKKAKPYSDLNLLNFYITGQNIKNVKSYEIFFDKTGKVQKNRILFVENHQSKNLDILPYGAFKYKNIKDFLKEDLLWARVFSSIPSEKITKKFGNSLRVISLSLEDNETENLAIKLNIIYEKNNSFNSTYLFFNKKGEKLKGRGEILSLFSINSNIQTPKNKIRKN